MSIQEEAGLILKLYELRREETLRQARDWYFREFNPQSLADFASAIMGEHSGHVRMVVTYWDMAAALVNKGAIDLEMFNEATGEQFGVFAKVELLLPEIRAAYGPQFLQNFEKLIDDTKGGRQRVAQIREMQKSIRAQIAAAQTA